VQPVWQSYSQSDIRAVSLTVVQPAWQQDPTHYGKIKWEAGNVTTFKIYLDEHVKHNNIQGYGISTALVVVIGINGISVTLALVGADSMG